MKDNAKRLITESWDCPMFGWTTLKEQAKKRRYTNRRNRTKGFRLRMLDAKLHNLLERSYQTYQVF